MDMYMVVIVLGVTGNFVNKIVFGRPFTQYQSWYDLGFDESQTYVVPFGIKLLINRSINKSCLYVKTCTLYLGIRKWDNVLILE